MPIRAFAEMACRSAAAMSGRRSRRVEASWAGTVGSVSPMAGVRAIEKLAGALPTSTASACSNCARAIPASISCARVLSSCVWAVMISLRAETPTAYLLFVILSVRL